MARKFYSEEFKEKVVLAHDLLAKVSIPSPSCDFAVETAR